MEIQNQLRERKVSRQYTASDTPLISASRSKRTEKNEPLGSNLIFIISQPRAGSTLLQRILGGHPDIHTTAEPWIMLHQLYALKDSGYSAEYNAEWAKWALEDFSRTLDDGEKTLIRAIRRMSLYLYESSLSGSGKNFFLDKTPRYYFIIPELHRVFPEAKYIFLLRNPLAVLSSILDGWVRKDWQKLSLYKNDLLKAPQLLADGIESMDGKAIVVNYEDMVKKPEKEMRLLCNKLRLDFYHPMINYGQTPKPKGRMGDTINIDKHKDPVAYYADKWINKLATSPERQVAREYLSFLGPHLLSRLGYTFDELQENLLSKEIQQGPVDSHFINDVFSIIGFNDPQDNADSPLLNRNTTNLLKCMGDSRKQAPLPDGKKEYSAFPNLIGGFSNFTYSRKSHFKLFKGYDFELYKKTIDPDSCDLKRYQDLLVCLFLKRVIPKGARICEVGGGKSRILKHFKNDYECWNLDRLEGERNSDYVSEGLGNGPVSFDSSGFRWVKDYIGYFNKKLPSNYFDFVFSISALEHVPDDQEKYLNDIKDDINRILKPGGYSLHCFDVVIKPDRIWANKLLLFLFRNQKTVNPFIALGGLENDPDLYIMTEDGYQKNWQASTKQSYGDFGKPLSYNILWQKPLAAEGTDTAADIREIKSQSDIGLCYLRRQEKIDRLVKKSSKEFLKKGDLPKISIVTPSFNQAEYLEECIDSILSQNYPNLEYIIMDGGSNDGSAEIIKKYEDRLTYWQSTPDQGQYWAINEGFKKSSGEILHWLNSDDKHHPRSLFYVAYIFNTFRNVQWIMGRPTVWDKKGTLVSVLDPLPQWSREKYLSRHYGPPHIQQESVFWRRSLWEKAGSYIDTTLRYAGDLELWSRFFRSSDLYTVDVLLGGFRTHSDQKTAKMMKEYDREANQIIDREIEIFNQSDETLLPAPKPITLDDMATGLETLNRRGEELFEAGDLEAAIFSFLRAVEQDANYAKAHNNLGFAYWRNGEVKKSLHHFEKALEIDPFDRAAVLNAGDILKTLGKPDDARNIYLSYLSKVSEDEEVTRAWETLKDTELDKAIVEIRKAETADYLVSAIVSTYSSEEFIHECLENLESQSISGKMEIVVVDAASPQNEEKIVKEFQKRYQNIAYIRTKGRIGIYTAWNIAIKAASGRYCISVSTNDCLRQNACEILTHALDENPDCMLVYGDTYLTKRPHETFENNTHYATYQWPPYSLDGLLKEPMVGPHPMWRKSIHKHIGYFDERYIADGDQEFWLRMGQRYKLLHIPEYTGLQWITPDALSRKGKTPHLELTQIHSLHQKRLARHLKSTKPKCSIIIPVFNKVEYTRKCLASLFENSPAELCEVIIVDNGSTDGTGHLRSDMGSHLKMITNKENLGFSRACNQGAAVASGEYLLFLNNDITVNNGWLEPLIHVLDEDPNVAAVGSKLLFPDGKIQHAGVIIIDDRKLPDPLVGRHIYYRQHSDFVEANHIRTYQGLTAACLLVRKSAFQEVGGFDEEYWNGYEDVDLCFKLQEKGWSLVYEPQSVAIHYESQSGPERFKQVSNNIKRLHKKWLGKILPDVVIEADGSITNTGAGKISHYASPRQKDGQYEIHTSDSRAFVSIIILTHNQLEYTRKCVESIYNYTEEPFELIVVDNGSNDDTIAYLESVARNRSPESTLKIIRNRENLGFAEGNNQGMNLASGDYILLMNNDVVVTPGWMDRMIFCAESSNEIGIVGPMTNYAPGQQLVKDVTYETNNLYGLNRFSEDFAKKNSHKGKRVLRVVGFCMLVKRAVIEKVGGMDKCFGLGNFEDDDFSLRATLCGFQSWIAQDCYVHHYGSRTFIGAKIDYDEILYRNWGIFKKKWKMPQDLPYGSYDLAQIGRHSFDPEIDYIPLVDKDALTSKEKKSTYLSSIENEAGGRTEIQSAKRLNIFEASIIIPTSNQQKYIKRCVESIRKHTEEPHEIVFVNDGCTKGVLKWLKRIVKEEANYQLVKCEKGGGLAKAYNEAIKASYGAYALFLHNDVVVSDGWLSGILKCIRSEANIGVAGPMANSTYGIQKDVNADYDSVGNFDEYAETFREKNRYRKVETRSVSGFCLMCKSELLKKIGLFDESMKSEKVMVEDLCLRMRIEGYKNVIAADVLLHHHDRHKWFENNTDMLGIMARESRLLDEKRRAMTMQDPIRKKLLTLNAIEKADELWQKDEIRGAFNVHMEAIRQFPEEKKLYYALSEILIDAKQYKEALELLNKIPSDAKDARKLELVGYCIEGMEGYSEAEELADQALSINPSSAPALNLKGMLAYRQKDLSSAEAFFNKAIEAAPSYGEPYANLGFMKWILVQAEEAFELFERGFILTPTVPDIFRNYHAAIKSLGEFARAERIFRDACALNPNNKRLKYLLIDILIQQGKHVEAMNEIEEAFIKFDVDDAVISAALEVRNRLGPNQVDRSAGKKASVSLCMIVKNEEEHIGKCLMNMKPLVDEMIVVDTGSTDRTKDIASIFGANVYDFEWTDDFSEARNFSLLKACGDWILVMDADEIISPADYETFRKIVKKSFNGPVAYAFVTRNYNIRADIIGLNPNDGRYGDEEAGLGWFPSEKVRLFTNGYNIRFEYPVHEIVEPFLRREKIEIKKCSIPVHHYGQLDSEKRACKGEEYYSIGRKKLDEMGDNDTTAIYELAVQAGMLGKWEEAIELWQRLISLRPNVPEGFVNMATAFHKIGKYGDAIELIKKAMKLDPNIKEAPNDYALYQLLSGNASEAVAVFEDVVERFPDYLSAQFKLAAAYCCIGKKEKGLKIVEKLRRTPMGPGLAISFHTIAKKLVSLKRIDYAIAVLEAAIESRNVNEDLVSLLEECRVERDRIPAVSDGGSEKPEAVLGI